MLAKFYSLAPEVLKKTTFGADSDENFVNMTDIRYSNDVYALFWMQHNIVLAGNNGIFYTRGMSCDEHV